MVIWSNVSIPSIERNNWKIKVIMYLFYSKIVPHMEAISSHLSNLVESWKIIKCNIG